MAEYIEKSTVLDIICKHWRSKMYADDAIQTALDEIGYHVPSADVVPVVRCKECQNSYEWANVDGDNYRYCGYLRDRWNHDYDRMVDDDDFCKWGRKMDGGDSDER